LKQKIAYISLIVDDYDEAIKFYTEKLHFNLIEDTAISDTKRWVLLAPTGANASVTDIIPEMKLYKTTTKTLVSDHDIPKGIRLFYKVRAVNAAGPGPWSEAVSKVQ